MRAGNKVSTDFDLGGARSPGEIDPARIAWHQSVMTGQPEADAVEHDVMRVGLGEALGAATLSNKSESMEDMLEMREITLRDDDLWAYIS